jgi:hypothetical protein
VDTPKTKPDLLAASPQPGGGKRILAALEHGAKPAARPARATAWTFDGWTAGLGLLLLLMLGVAWMLHGETSTPSAARHRDGGGAGGPPITAGTRLEAPPTPAPATGQAAAIVNESPAAGAPPALAAKDVARPDGTAQNPPTRGAPPPHKQSPTGSGTTARTPQTTMVRNAAGASAGAGPGAGARVASGATAARDTDVTLLTALVAHANEPTVTVAERSRDVVERKEGDSTAQLLARCRQLGVIEGLLCRSRICSGRWDQDAACRAPAH